MIGRPGEHAVIALLVLVVVAAAQAGLATSQATSEPASTRPVASQPALEPTTGPASTQPTSRTAGSDRGRGASSRPTSQPTTRPASLETAGRLFTKGDYAAATHEYQSLLADPAMRVRAIIGLVETFRIQGRYDKAAEALAAVADAGGGNAQWRLAMAETLACTGKYAEALEQAGKAHELAPSLAAAILAHGEALEVLGRKAEAVEVYRTMDKALLGEAWRRDAQALTAMGGILDRFAILTGRKASDKATEILHDYFQKAYQEADKDYWPANLAAGMFLLSKHKPEGAAQEFELANKINPRIPDVFVGRGMLSLEQWNFEEALSQADAALGINPNHADAMLLKAVIYMQWRKFENVPPLLEKILAVNPNHLDALSLQAAWCIRMGKGDHASPFIERVRKVDPAYAGLPNAIGEWLAAARQFSEAEKYYKQAMELAPEQAEPVTNLGLLYMQMGREDEARVVLAKARQIDDFRSDVFNYLKVLEKLSSFQTKQTEHFVIRVADPDAVLLEPMAEYLEQAYEEVCADFDYKLPDKTIVEVLPTHEDFSIRITGRSWIGTVGASTGRVIVLATPDRQRSQLGTFNWATVLRHELTHSVTLSATDNRIPHWFTEACAVWEQPDRRNYDAVRALTTATRTGKLFSVRELDWGFIRPKQMGDRSLAYAQAEWMLEYLISTRKFEIVGKLLEGFRSGRTQAEVFKNVLGITEDQFDKDFRVWASEQVTLWGFPADAPPDLAKSQAAVKVSPLDPAAHEAMALAAFYAGQLDQAEQSARQAIRLDAKRTRAMAVLASVLMTKENHDEAIAVATRLDQLDGNSIIAPDVLARCQLAKHDWAKAISALETLKLRKPLDPFAYNELAKLYLQLGQQQLALPNLVELYRRSVYDPQYARQIAEIYGAQDDPASQAKAIEYWQEVVRINPYEASAYKAITSLYITLERYDAAAASARSQTLLQPDSGEAWTYQAIALYHLGQARKDPAVLTSAKQAVEKAIKLDPSSSMAKRMSRRIDSAIESLAGTGTGDKQ